MNILKKIYSNWVVKNLFWAIVFIVVVLGGVSLGLSIYTQHNNTVSVPDLVGQPVSYAREKAASKELQLIVSDSVFVSNFKRGAVYSQNPKAGTHVKKGRKVYVVHNAVNVKLITMPNVVGLSMRQARVNLAAAGFNPGKLVYVDDIATNIVIAPMVRGEKVDRGSRLPWNTTVDLMVGLNRNESFSRVPDLRGMTGSRAESVIYNNSFNLRRAEYDETVLNAADSAAAVIYRQYPEPDSLEYKLGTNMLIYLTRDLRKLSSNEPEQSVE